MRDVVMWDVQDVPWDDEYSDPRHVTDVFHRSARPKPGSLMLGLEGLAGPDRQVGGLAITTLALARSSQAVATQKDRVRMEPLAHLETSVSFSDLSSRLDSGAKRRFKEARLPGPLVTIRLSPQLGASLIEALSEVSDEAARLIESWVSAGSERVTGRTGLRLREERDAVQLALDLAGMSPPEMAIRPVASTVPENPAALASVFKDEVVTDIEDDLIAEDLRRFDPRGTLELRRASVARFEDDDIALTIMNVNRKPLENVLGVDLVYWDEVAGIFTLVQYKRLTAQKWERSALNPTWAFTRRSELRAQLERMNLGRPRVSGVLDWRLAPSPFWFKFLRAEDFVSGDPWVLRGMYVPADFLRLAIDDNELRDGPRGGFAVTYGNTKYLTRDMFVELVRRGLVGTTRSGTRRMLGIIAQLAEADEVVIALKTSAANRPKMQTLHDSLDEPF